MKYFADIIEIEIDETYFDKTYPIESNVMSKFLDLDAHLGIVRTYYSYLSRLNRSICLFD